MEHVELEYGAISIDNDILKNLGYKFDEGLLKQLVQFEKSYVKVVQTDIVHNEAIKHIGQEVVKTRSAITQALRSAGHQLKITSDKIEGARELLSIEGNESTLADERLRLFYRTIGAEIIDSNEHVDFQLLMEMYFETNPPFETGKDKKCEFPDAIALLTLDDWADENNVNVIAVSKDQGWKKYSEDSHRITVVDNLAEAFEKFLPHKKVEDIIDKINTDSVLDNGNHVLEQIKEAISDSLEGADICVEASSSYFYEYEEVWAMYKAHQLLTNQSGAIDIKVVRIEEELIVLKLAANVKCNVEANFDFSVRDSVDRDYVGLGGSVCNVEEEYSTDILLTLGGDFSQDFSELDIFEIEVLETISSADFGEVEPNWHGYDEL